MVLLFVSTLYYSLALVLHLSRLSPKKEKERERPLNTPSKSQILWHCCYFEVSSGNSARESHSFLSQLLRPVENGVPSQTDVLAAWVKEMKFLSPPMLLLFSQVSSIPRLHKLLCLRQHLLLLPSTDFPAGPSCVTSRVTQLCSLLRS